MTRGKPPRALSRTRPQDLQRRRTAAHARRESRTGHAQGRRQHDGCGITSSHRRAAAHSAKNHDEPRPADLAQKDPSYNPTTRGRATRPSNACWSDTLTGKTSTCPTHATDTRRVEASLSSPWCQTRTKTQRLPPTSPGQGPRFPDPCNPPATEKGAAPHPDRSFHLTLLSRDPDPQGAGQRARQITRDPRPGR